jgi:DNA/RNA endonuclease G (NUC1)
MPVREGICGLILSISFAVSAQAFGLADCTLDDSAAEESRIEHLYGGAPDDAEIHARRAYVFAYNGAFKVPQWAAWSATKEFRDTPKRKKRWKTLRTDPLLPDVKARDYRGWFDTTENYARGHIVPYFISGGDRDNDGMDAEFEENLRVEDEDDACTVFEINAMSNIAPQFHTRFNGQPGVWWLLETHVRSMLDHGREFQLFAGTIFLDDVEVRKIGRKDAPETWDIGVPHGFFKIVIDPAREQAIGFLFDHAGDLASGCNIDDASVAGPAHCIRDITQIEAATGLKFFAAFSNAKRQRLLKGSTPATWSTWIGRED